MRQRIVLAYSGSLADSVAIAWLAETRGADIVTLTLDLGQGGELAEIRDRALSIGATRAHVIDAREEFAREFVLPALTAGALHEGRYPMAAALARPLVARKLVEVALIEQAGAIGDASSAGRADQIRGAATDCGVAREVEVIALAGAWGMTRARLLDYARRQNLPVPADSARAYDTDANLWGRTIEWHALDASPADTPDDVYVLTQSPAKSPGIPADVEITFTKGVPTAINGVSFGFAEVVESLSIIAGQHGVGRDTQPDQPGARGPRRAFEAPAAVVLHAAHNALETLVSSADLHRLKETLSAAYEGVVSSGLWFTPIREALDAFNARVQQQVTGTVGVRLLKGQHSVVGRIAPAASAELVTRA